MTKYTYHYLSASYAVDAYRRRAGYGGAVYRLRRSDGKLVKVSNKRLGQLRDEGRLSLRDETPKA
jgi:hypothetical protein